MYVSILTFIYVLLSTMQYILVKKRKNFLIILNKIKYLGSYAITTNAF